MNVPVGKKSGPAAKPVFLSCYLCGQQFGSASLGIHQPQCYQKKLTDWKNGDPNTRGPKPKDPATLDIDAPKSIIGNAKEVERFNNEQFGDFTQNLSPCPNCGRKFLPDRLQVHLRSCNPDNSGGGSKPVKGKELASQLTRPRTRDHSPAVKPQLLVCYLCGQQFGTASLGIHQPQCYRKKMIEWENAEPGTRGAKPRDPATMPKQGPVDLKDPNSIDKFNDENFANFNANLAPCPNCGRTFNPDRLVVHLRSCRPDASGGGSKPVHGRVSGGGGGGGGESSPTRPASGAGSPSRGGLQRAAVPGQKPVALVCYLCGQQFGTASLKIHAPQCYAKQMRIWENGDPATRGPQPRDPATVDLNVPNKLGGEGVDDFNSQQYGQWSDNLSPCPNCGRKFLPDRLQVHLRSCKGGGLKPGRTSSGGDDDDGLSPPASGAAVGRSPGSGKSRSPLNNRLPTDSARAHSDEDMFASEGNGNRVVKHGRRASEDDEPPPRGGPKFDDSAAYDDDGGGGSVNLVQCEKCGRRFAAERLARHQDACFKMKQRKVFNSAKHRAEGTDMKGNQPSMKREVAAPKANWREKHLEFQRTLKQAKQVDKCIKEGGDLSALPPPPPSVNPDYVQCPYCERRFNQTAAERHIPKCKDTVNKPKPPPRRPPMTSPVATSSSSGGHGPRAVSPSPAAASPKSKPRAGLKPLPSPSATGSNQFDPFSGNSPVSGGNSISARGNSTSARGQAPSSSHLDSALQPGKLPAKKMALGSISGSSSAIATPPDSPHARPAVTSSRRESGLASSRKSPTLPPTVGAGTPKLNPLGNSLGREGSIGAVGGGGLGSAREIGGLGVPPGGNPRASLRASLGGGGGGGGGANLHMSVRPAFCSECGFRFQDSTALFCQECGTPV